MKHGHVQGTKRERKDSSEWYRKHEQENLERIEREWAAKQAETAIQKD